MALDPAASKLQVAVFGAGSFGQNHIRVYGQLEQDGQPVHLAAVIDPAFSDPTHPGLLQLPPETRVFTCWEECLAAHRSGELRLAAASICTPTKVHHLTASACLINDIHVLVEKPMTDNLEEADHLVGVAHARNLVLQVGHLERFNPAVQAFLPHLNHPMFFEAHRLSIFTPRSLDVDVVLDLMVHDLDVVLTFAKSPVREIRAVGLPILSPKTDIANVRLEFESGCVANFTASRVSTERVRKLRFFQPRQYVSIDYARQEILFIETTASAPEILSASGLASETRVSMPPLNLPGLKITKPEVVKGEPLRLEIESFLNAIRTGTRPVVPGDAGRAALALALEITATMEAHIQSAGLKPQP